MTDTERRAVERVKRACGETDEWVILCFVRTAGAATILRSSLKVIRDVAYAF